MASVNDSGVKALRLLIEVEPPSLLVPNSTVSETARAASKYLFSSLRPFSLKSPLDQLLVDGYDAEQIWHQIDLQSQPLLSTLRRRLNQLAKNPEEIAELKKVPSNVANKAVPKEQDQGGEEFDGFDEELDEADEDEDDEEGTEGEGEEDEDDEEEEKGESGGIGDKFLKIDELNDYLQKEEDNYEKGEEGDQDSEADDDLEKVKLIALCLVVIGHCFYLFFFSS